MAGLLFGVALLVLEGAWVWFLLKPAQWCDWPEEVLRVALALVWPVCALGSLGTSIARGLGRSGLLLVSPEAAAYGTVALSLGVAGFGFRCWYTRASREGSAPATSREFWWLLLTLVLCAVGAACASPSFNTRWFRPWWDGLLFALFASPLLGLVHLLLSWVARCHAPSTRSRRVGLLVSCLVPLGLCMGSWDQLQLASTVQRCDCPRVIERIQ